MSSTDCDTKNVLQNTVDDEEDVPIVPKRPHIYDGDYFEIVSREKDAIIVRWAQTKPLRANPSRFMLSALQLSYVWTGGCIVASRTHIVQQHSEARQTKASRPDEQTEDGEENQIANATIGSTFEGKQ